MLYACMLSKLRMNDIFTAQDAKGAKENRLGFDLLVFLCVLGVLAVKRIWLLLCPWFRIGMPPS
jgi:hypothetical protein